MKLLALAATFLVVMVVDGSKIKSKFASRLAQQDGIPAEWADWLASFNGEFPPPPPQLAQRQRAQQGDIPPEWIDWLHEFGGDIPPPPTSLAQQEGGDIPPEWAEWLANFAPPPQ